jgi:hypothetical protein
MVHTTSSIIRSTESANNKPVLVSISRVLGKNLEVQSEIIITYLIGRETRAIIRSIMTEPPIDMITGSKASAAYLYIRGMFNN